MQRTFQLMSLRCDGEWLAKNCDQAHRSFPLKRAGTILFEVNICSRQYRSKYTSSDKPIYRRYPVSKKLKEGNLRGTPGAVERPYTWEVREPGRPSA